MSFLEHLVSQEKSGSITKKDALDMKMNYLSLNQKERDELDGQYSFNKKTETSVAKKIKVNPEKKTTKKKVVNKKINKENVFSEKLLVNFMKGISPNNYQLIFDSYYVFLKNKFGQNKEVDNIIEEAARKQLRGGEAEKFYNEYINRKVKENSNYDKQIDSEIRQKVLYLKKNIKKNAIKKNNDPINPLLIDFILESLTFKNILYCFGICIVVYLFWPASSNPAGEYYRATTYYETIINLNSDGTYTSRSIEVGSGKTASSREGTWRSKSVTTKKLKNNSKYKLVFFDGATTNCYMYQNGCINSIVDDIVMLGYSWAGYPFGDYKNTAPWCK